MCPGGGVPTRCWARADSPLGRATVTPRVCERPQGRNHEKPGRRRSHFSSRVA